MDIQQCWAHYIKADQLLEQGHWPEAHYLFEQVLRHMPEHLQKAVKDTNTKLCQFTCLVTGIRDAAVSQSQILNRMGQYQDAYNILNQTYALVQFIAIEPSHLVRSTQALLNQQSDDLFSHMAAFCASQRNAHWLLEFELVQKAHHYFDTLKSQPSFSASAQRIN